jgi:hypothetical protein
LRFEEHSQTSNYDACIVVDVGTKLADVYDRLQSKFHEKGYELQQAFSDVDHTILFPVRGEIWDDLVLYGEGVCGMSDAEQAMML